MNQKTRTAAKFWSSSFLQAKGLEGESKALPDIGALSGRTIRPMPYTVRLSACMMVDTNTTAPSLQSVHHVDSTSARNASAMHVAALPFRIIVKDVVLK